MKRRKYADQLEVMIGSFLQERKEEKLSGIFSQHIYVRDARIPASSLPYERSDDRKASGTVQEIENRRLEKENWN